MPLEELYEGILAGDRRCLSKAITLVESRRKEDGVLADDLLNKLSTSTGKSLRIGVTGIPGAGKSTFIEALSLLILKEHPHRIAVLSVDPSSHLRRGSVLADKTRMLRLTKSERVFVRPSPAGGVLGGVAEGTCESIRLCEAAGYTIIFVETVGVGQGEVLVQDMVDICVLLLLGGTGDELQGIKKGIIEVADIFLLHKIEREDVHTVARNIQLYRGILTMSARSSTSRRAVMACSSLSGQGIADVWQQLKSMEHTMRANNSFHTRRDKQNISWLHHHLRDCMVQELYSRSSVAGFVRSKEQAVREHLTSARTAARDIVSFYKRARTRQVS